MKNAINNLLASFRTMNPLHRELVRLAWLLGVGALVTAGLMACFGLTHLSR